MAGVLNAVGHELRRDAVVLALLDAARAALDPDARKQRRPRLLRHSFGGADARGGRRDIGRALQPFGDQRVELRIAKSLPPALDRPGTPCIGKSRRRFKRLGRSRGRSGTEIGNAGAARKQAQHKGGGENPIRHGIQ